MNRFMKDPGLVVDSKIVNRVKLCAQAVEAGLEHETPPSWWKELAPLTIEEIKMVKEAVKRVVEKSKIKGA